MSLTLFANNERSNNSPVLETINGVSYTSSVFYREKRNGAYRIIYQLQDDQTGLESTTTSSLLTSNFATNQIPTEVLNKLKQTQTLSALSYNQISTFASSNIKQNILYLAAAKYVAEYSLDNKLTFTPFPLSGVLVVDVVVPLSAIETDTPYIHSITVSVTSLDFDANTRSRNSTSVYRMSAVFLKKIPEIDFIAYPTYYVEEKKYPTTAVKLSASTFMRAGSGLYFYGEGHTETINLSARIKDAKAPLVRWLVGGDVVKNGIPLSKFYVDSLNFAGTLAKVKIPSTPNKEEIHDIGAKLQDLPNFIGQLAPVVRYDDFTGQASYYPFFAATVKIDGESRSIQGYTSPIRVLKYPEPIQVSFKNPFSSPLIFIPADKDSIDIKTELTTNPRLSTFLTQARLGTYWTVEAKAENGSWSIQTGTAPEITSYGFSISYDPDYNYSYLPLYTASLISDTTLLVTASTVTTSLLRIYGEQASLPEDLRDWQPRTQTQVSNFLATVLSTPLEVKPYFNSYFNLKYAEVPVSLQSVIAEPYSLSAVDLKFNLSKQTIRLSPREPNATVIFNKIGKVNVTAIAYIRNTKTQSIVSKTFVYEDAIEIVESFETVKEDSMHSRFSSQQLVLGAPPLLTPNEWLTNSTINTTLESLHNTFKKIDNFSDLYEQKDKLFAWFSFQQAASEDPLLQTTVYNWADLECDEQAESENEFFWYNFECKNPDDEKQTKSFRWMDQLCEFQTDPECLQRHCLQWSWRKRKRANSDAAVTWKSTKTGELYNKKWAYEKCELDSDFLQCSRTNWNVESLEPRFFPIPTAKGSSYCKVIDVEYLEGIDKLIVAHEREIRLLNNSKSTEYVCRRGQADELYPFQDIAAIATNSSGNVFVLDRLLPRVCVFAVKDNRFSAINSWGDYGANTDEATFDEPSDIHVDQEDFVWVADTGNKCVKKFTITGNFVLGVQDERFNTAPPVSMCVDVDKRVHVLTKASVLVFSEFGSFLYEYKIDTKLKKANKINTNYIRRMIYITGQTGVAKYFRNGNLSHFTIIDYVCKDNSVLQNYNSVTQDKHRNVFVTCVNKVLKFGDTMKMTNIKGDVQSQYWKLEEILIDKDEFVQPWVYMRAFHRLWDNIESLRFSLFYQPGTCKAYGEPLYLKDDFVIGQNELVTNAVFNRLINQIWENMRSVIKYFSVDCEK